MSDKAAGASRRVRRIVVHPAARGPAASSGAAPAPVRAPATFAEAMAFLLDRTNYEHTPARRPAAEVFKLDRMRALLEVAGTPQQTQRFVHIAGTKGKGSTCEMTAACLEACGYTVGAFTSPHLVSIRERLRINRVPISEQDFTRLAAKAAEAEAAVRGSLGRATFFELMTLMGLAYFAEQAVDVSVIEVGLGGRLDTTNVITPDVAAVTTIGRDHMEILGNTLEEIAAEKAGIFKPGVPAITIPQAPGVRAVLAEAAERVGAPFSVVGEHLEFTSRFEHSALLGPHCKVSLSTARSAFEHLVVPLKGEHQAYNCGLALAILDSLKDKGFRAPEDRVAQGLASTRLEGRLECVQPAPGSAGSSRIYLDVAHNEESIRALMRTIGSHVTYDSMVVVFGCCADKDVGAMLKELALGADKVIFTRAADTRRAADPAELASRFSAVSDKMSQQAPTLRAALDMARRAVGRSDIVCITGSFYLVGEAKRLLGQRSPGA